MDSVKPAKDAVPPMVPSAEELVYQYMLGKGLVRVPRDMAADLVRQAYRDGFNASDAARERASIVAWLRKVAEGLHAAVATTLANHYSLIADRIERGEHARATMPDTGADKS